MYKLFVHADAMADLRALHASDPVSEARIVALLQEIEGNQDLLDRLTQHDYGRERTAPFNVSKWLEKWNKSTDLWRIKLWDLEDKGVYYRIIYAYMRGKQLYHVLAIAPRNFDYDTTHELSQRIQRAYDGL